MLRNHKVLKDPNFCSVHPKSFSNRCSFQLSRARCLSLSKLICPDLIAIALSNPIRSLLNPPRARRDALQFLPSQIFEDGPIIHMIIIEALAHEEVTEDFAQIGVFRFLVKTKRTDVVEINRKFLREIRAQILGIDPSLFL